MKIKLTTLLILFIGSNAFAQKDWKTLEQDSYAISYPKNWLSSDEKPQPSMQFLLLADETSQNADKFRENINLTIEELTGQTIDISGYVKLSIDQITSQIPGARILSNEPIEIDGWEAKSIIWIADFGNGMELKFKQVMLLQSGKAYVLTFSSTTAEYDKYIKVGNQILSSFKLAK